MAEGWNCPNCGKAHAPHVHTCPESPRQEAKPLPYWKQEFLDGLKYDPCAHCKGICGNVACPKRVVITC